MPAPIPIGNDIFRSVRERGLEYIDKTRLIQDILDDAGTMVLLLPRPRRFGKTLNMTMLEAFFARRAEDLTHLFEGLHIWSAGEKYRAHFQRYPTIFLTFKNLKPGSAEAWDQAIRMKVSELYRRHVPVFEDLALAAVERRELEHFLDGTASDVLLQRGLERLSAWLHRAYGEQVLILVDEYDTPIHEAWRRSLETDRPPSSSGLFAGGASGVSSLYDKVVSFFKDFFGAALKGNEHLFRGVLTGILRVSKESIFSDLNNLNVKTLLEPEFSDAFGFTEEETRALCERQGQLEHLPTIRTWYNGYCFGGRTVYNPWSVLSFLNNKDKTPQSHWLNSSSNDLVKQLIMKRGVRAHKTFRPLLEGGRIVTRLETNLVFPSLERSDSALVALLLFSGYLEAERVPGEPGEQAVYALSIPNREVMEVYQTTFREWLEASLGGFGGETELLLEALLSGDEERLEEMLGKMALRTMSIQDQTATRPESFYHGLMLGLCAALEP